MFHIRVDPDKEIRHDQSSNLIFTNFLVHCTASGVGRRMYRYSCHNFLIMYDTHARIYLHTNLIWSRRGTKVTFEITRRTNVLFDTDDYFTHKQTVVEINRWLTFHCGKEEKLMGKRALSSDRRNNSMKSHYAIFFCFRISSAVTRMQLSHEIRNRFLPLRKLAWKWEALDVHHWQSLQSREE